MKQKIWNRVTSVALSTLVGTTVALLSSPSQGQTSNVNVQPTLEASNQALSHSSPQINSNLNPSNSNNNSVSSTLSTSKKTTVAPSRQSAQPKNNRKQGMASWYGNGFSGRRTANGETFNPGQLTAAHRTLPFGTKVRVTNLRNGRSVVVRINDRGPHTRGRVIDLSTGAARLIGVLQSGLAPVAIEVLGR